MSSYAGKELDTLTRSDTVPRHFADDRAHPLASRATMTAQSTASKPSGGKNKHRRNKNKTKCKSIKEEPAKRKKILDGRTVNPADKT